ncbi:putative carbonic anhydrase [Xylona heveae TC161]|uniref:Carbonic anhydrase n=1 Tax=Xylona heveae (strain CBS 132557 / TC161) TaxID=1328760 RepID=A0A165ACD1_XYLHT|nr:putative carbonic anhydrase [Xylona heveae TC161]KZF20247.1 putative carbonic anhydrase [Xylona heveae TC161]
MTHGNPDVFDLALAQNKSWAYRTAAEDPNLFPSLASGQKPEILWIGCADSRIPETTVLGLKPGDIFVHRNIANILHPGDVNAQSVIEYAVVYLQVKHVVICGHTSCGGVNAALGNKKLGVIDTWLHPLRSLRMQHNKDLRDLSQPEAALKLVELNVRKGVQVLKENPAIIDAVRERGLQLHGIVYQVANGELKELDTSDSPEDEADRKAAFQLEP